MIGWSDKYVQERDEGDIWIDWLRFALDPAKPCVCGHSRSKFKPLRIDQQINLIKSAVDAMLPRASWLWMDENGTYFLPIKYGRYPIELKKGMFAIQCKNAEEAVLALTAVRSMALKICECG